MARKAVTEVIFIQYWHNAYAACSDVLQSGRFQWRRKYG